MKYRKGGLISKSIHNLFASTKRWPKSLFLIFSTERKKKRDSDFGSVIFGFDQIWNTFWDYPKIKDSNSRRNDLLDMMVDAIREEKWTGIKI